MAHHRSIAPEFIPQIIKEYDLWTLMIHEDQRYLGRAVAWLVRPGQMQDYFDCTSEEKAELEILVAQYKRAMSILWQPDKYNYAWLANLHQLHGGHGHMHLIPRYKEPRSFAGLEFVDGRWDQNCWPATVYEPPPEILYKIRDAIKVNL